MSQAVAPPTGVKRVASPPFNPLLVRLLRSPFHALAGDLLLVGYRGRRSGRERSFPVAYAMAGDDIAILVGHAGGKTWWRNFLSSWPLTVVRRGRTLHGEGVVVRGDTAEGAALAEAYVARHPRAAGVFGASSPPATFVRFRAAREA